MAQKPLWQPSETQRQQTQMSAFMRFVGKQDLDYQQLWQWSVDQPEQFWSQFWSFAELVPALNDQVLNHPEKVLENSGQMPGARWFPDLKMNFAENLLKRCRDDDFDASKAALVFRDEAGNRSSLSYIDLYFQVAQLAASFKTSGVQAGDRVVGFMPNVPETVVAMLAATSMGAIWSSCSPDFGLQGVLDRFGQIEPKVLITTDGYYYGGKTLDSLSKVERIVEHLPSLQQLVVVNYINKQADSLFSEASDSKISNSKAADLSAFDGRNFKTTHWADYLDERATAIIYEQLPFDHPLYVMYSSGTTGVPKCMIHSAGGTLIQHAKELMLHTDLKQDDTIFYYTTCGWMMWNWLVSSLMTGATLVLFDGSPFHPGPEVLWDMAEQEGVSIFGTSAKYIAALEKAGVKPAQSHDVSALKAILSTGSPLAHESFDYVYRDIKSDLCLSSISGGTDIISCFVLGNPNLPVWRGELQCVGLGMAVSIYDETGKPVQDQKGELVCEKVFPSMPVGFWNDADGKKFHKAYFASWPGVWAHGDYGELVHHDQQAHLGMIIHGRSDAVLNPGGVRIGTAEIYRQVEQVKGVVESIAVGQHWHDDVRVVLFVVLAEGRTLDDALINEIRTTIRKNTTPRHVPAKVIQVADIPRTISGKIVELAVRNVIHGESVKNTDALKNPEALALFKDLEELKV